MADKDKIIVRILDDLSPSQMKLRSISRGADGLYNMHLNERGQVEKRKGYTLYSTVKSGTDQILGLHRYYNEETKEKVFLAACYNKIYSIDDEYPFTATAIPFNEGV